MIYKALRGFHYFNVSSMKSHSVLQSVTIYTM